MTTFSGYTQTTLLQTLSDFDQRSRMVPVRELSEEEQALREKAQLARKYGLIPA